MKLFAFLETSHNLLWWWNACFMGRFANERKTRNVPSFLPLLTNMKWLIVRFSRDLVRSVGRFVLSSFFDSENVCSPWGEENGRTVWSSPAVGFPFFCVWRQRDDSALIVPNLSCVAQWNVCVCVCVLIFAYMWPRLEEPTRLYIRRGLRYRHAPAFPNNFRHLEIFVFHVFMNEILWDFLFEFGTDERTLISPTFFLVGNERFLINPRDLIILFLNPLFFSNYFFLGDIFKKWFV